MQNNVSAIKHLVSLNFMSPQPFALNLGKVMEVLTYCFALFFTHSGSAKVIFIKDFPGSSAGKESTCNAGEPSLIPRLGRSTGEGIGYPLQYSWTSLVAQLVKNLPAMQETWVRSLGWEDPLEKGMTTHSSILAWRIPWTL